MRRRAEFSALSVGSFEGTGGGGFFRGGDLIAQELEEEVDAGSGFLGVELEVVEGGVDGCDL